MWRVNKLRWCDGWKDFMRQHLSLFARPFTSIYNIPSGHMGVRATGPWLISRRLVGGTHIIITLDITRDSVDVNSFVLCLRKGHGESIISLSDFRRYKSATNDYYQPRRHVARIVFTMWVRVNEATCGPGKLSLSFYGRVLMLFSARIHW